MWKNKILSFLKKEIKKPILLVLDILIAMGSALLVLLFLTVIEEFHYTLRLNYNNERSFNYRLEAEEYASMVFMYHENVAAGYGEKKELQEYYAIANYFEAAVDYQQDAQEEDKEKMEEAYAKMGDFSFVRETIDKKLGMQ